MIDSKPLEPTATRERDAAWLKLMSTSSARVHRPAGAASNFGLMRRDVGDDDGACKAWEVGTSLGGGLAMKNLAHLHETRGDDGEAESLYRRLLGLGSHDAGLKLGRLVRENGDLPKARARLRATEDCRG